MKTTPLWNEEYEKSVLGAILIDGASAVLRVSDFLGPEMFYYPPYGSIYRAMLDMAAIGEPIDILTVSSRLGGTENKTANLLIELADFVPTAANIEAYAREVETCHLRRQLQKVGADIGQLAGESDVAEALTKAEQMVFSLSQRSVKPLRYFPSVLGERWDRVYASRDNPGAIGLLTGFKPLDDALGGLQPADLVVLAARPSMGKSAFAVQVAQNVARKGGKVVVFSLEMSGESITDRAICGEAEIDSQAYRTRTLSTDEWDKGTQAVSRLMSLPIWLDATPAITTAEMRAKCRRLKVEHGGLALVVIDFLQLIGDKPSSGWSKNDHVGQVTNRCKALAREIDCPVLLLSQLNRQVENTADKIPQLSHLRDSGEIEQTADVVLFLHRPEYYDRQDQPGVARVIIAKNRNGPTGRVDLAFAANYMKFRLLERRREDGPRQEREQGTYLCDQ